MKLRVQVVVETETGPPEIVEEVACLERGALQPDELGLTLAEAKQLLSGVQRTLVTQQAAEYVTQHQHCSDCGKILSHKGKHEIVVRSLFGKLNVLSPRFYTCKCRAQSQGSFSPLAQLLRERTTPELLYLEAKFAARISYGATVDLLSDVLPLSDDLAVASVHRQVQQVAKRIEAELGEELVGFGEERQTSQINLPIPESPLVVALDGGYVRSRESPSRQDGWFEVVTGRSAKADCGKCFAFVYRHDIKPRRRLYEVLKAQGLQGNQLVTFLTDGGDTVRDLSFDLHPEAEHVLDWFHVTMRLTVMNQMAKGLPAQSEITSSAKVAEELESLKWNLWHGNVSRAETRCDDLAMDLEAMQFGEPTGSSTQTIPKLWKTIGEFRHYIQANRKFIPNYGDRYRHGEPISSASAEATVNQVVSKRFVKKQQMRWTEQGAHLLLQLRVKVLNDELRQTFQRWYPGMRVHEATLPSVN